MRSPTILEKYLFSSDVNITSPPCMFISWASVTSVSLYLKGLPAHERTITGITFSLGVLTMVILPSAAGSSKNAPKSEVSVNQMSSLNI